MASLNRLYSISQHFSLLKNAAVHIYTIDLHKLLLLT